MKKFIVKHSETKPAWNIVGTQLGRKYKIARFPYCTNMGSESLEIKERKEALKHARICCKELNKKYCSNKKKSKFKFMSVR